MDQIDGTYAQPLMPCPIDSRLNETGGADVDELVALLLAEIRSSAKHAASLTQPTATA